MISNNVKWLLVFLPWSTEARTTRTPAKHAEENPG